MIEEKIRKFENWHILLWLFKDLCWVMGFKVFGTIMIIPTVLLAFIITFKTRKIPSEFIHNWAVVCWICANSSWMLGEFFFDGEDGIDPRILIIPRILFVLGIGILFVYYSLFYLKMWRK
jgi:hypothetical protein